MSHPAANLPILGLWVLGLERRARNYVFAWSHDICPSEAQHWFKSIEGCSTYCAVIVQTCVCSDEADPIPRKARSSRAWPLRLSGINKTDAVRSGRRAERRQARVSLFSCEAYTVYSNVSIEAPTRERPIGSRPSCSGNLSNPVKTLSSSFAEFDTVVVACLSILSCNYSDNTV